MKNILTLFLFIFCMLAVVTSAKAINSPMMFGVTGAPNKDPQIPEVDVAIVGKSIYIDTDETTFVSIRELATENSRVSVKMRVYEGTANVDLAMWDINPDFSYGSVSAENHNPVSMGSIVYYESSFNISPTGLSRGSLRLYPSGRFRAHVSVEYLPEIGTGPAESNLKSLYNSTFTPFTYINAGIGKPLVISLHSFSSRHNAYDIYDHVVAETQARGWSFISPDYEAFGTGLGTGHPKVLRDINDAIDWATDPSRGNLMPSKIYIIGGSGGGYTALAYAVSGATSNLLAGAASLVGFSDLLRWYTFTKLRIAEAPTHNDFGVELKADLGNSLRGADWVNRSPIHNALDLKVPVYLQHGVHDNTVSPYQSISFYNMLAEGNGDYANTISSATIRDVYKINRDLEGSGSGNTSANDTKITNIGPHHAQLELTETGHGSNANIVYNAFEFFENLP